ncbi:Cytochrome c1 precursor [Candidatus Hodgkinia cicadicola]|nr:Cytochrome c1 precursor [Candidatus Hodgkinia cicadicola]
MSLLAKQGLGINVASVRRGFEVYRQICSKCHSLELFKLEDLKQLGYSKKQILELANGKRVSRRFKLPYSSRTQAKAVNNGVVPPDLSLITKYKGTNRIKNVFLGYTRINSLASPIGEASYYNNSFDGGITLMPPVLLNGVVKYASRVPRTLIQYILDVTEFLLWVSEPWLNLRGRLILPAVGVFSTMCFLFLIILKQFKTS